MAKSDSYQAPTRVEHNLTAFSLEKQVNVKLLVARPVEETSFRNSRAHLDAVDLIKGVRR